jgi:hypothetical protein
VKRRVRARILLRTAGRLAAVAVGLLVILLVGIQFARAIGQNIVAARELSSVRSDIVALRQHRAEQLRELRRLEDPNGAVPEIHDRLRLVRPNEAIIFVSPAPAAPQ